MTTIPLPVYLANMLDALRAQYDAMAATFGPPRIVLLGKMPVYRYSKQSDTLLCFLKGAKLVSTLNACVVLHSAGYAQEMYALIRVADDCCSDIIFMLIPKNGTNFDANQERFFHDFYQEEFADTGDVLGSHQKRDTVTRRHIHASFARMAKEVVNPSDIQTTTTVIHNVFSGYVHSAYPHIMELYGGDPGQFHLKGMAGTPRQGEAARCLTDQCHRAIMASELVAKKIGFAECAAVIRDLLKEFETTLRLFPSDNPAELMRKAKKKCKRPVTAAGG